MFGYMTPSPREAFVWTTRGPEPAGNSMLLELVEAGDPMGCYVWQVFRMVATWIGVEEDSRAGLYEADDLDSLTYGIVEKQAVTQLPSCALVTILAEISKSQPRDATIAFACLAAAEWATRNEYPETALNYFTLAAGVADDSRHAWTAGATFRARGRVRDADRWFRIAHAAATREKDWVSKVKALLSHAGIALHVGRYQEARLRLTKALRVSERKCLTEYKAEVHHDLFVVGAVMGDHSFAQAQIEAACLGYGHTHPRLSRFAHDLALYWMERGDYPHALTLLLPLVQNHFRDEPHLLLLALSSAARAAGGAREHSTFDALVVRFDDLRRTAPVEWPQLSPALLHVARGAIQLRDWTLAKTCLTESIASARRTGQHDVIFTAEELLQNVGKQLNSEPEVHAIAANETLASRTARLLVTRLR
jgi:tetratricopeptide (TPR) repeat protein